MEKNGIHACAYRFESNPDIRVEWRGPPGLWAVISRGLCLNKDGEWEYEPMPSNRTEEFIERCRFTLDEALVRAVCLK